MSVRLKASELIEKLQKYIDKYGDLEVNTEGCDCDGPACAVDYVKYDGAIPDEGSFMILRSPSKTPVPENGDWLLDD